MFPGGRMKKFTLRWKNAKVEFNAGNCMHHSPAFPIADVNVIETLNKNRMEEVW